MRLRFSLGLQPGAAGETNAAPTDIVWGGSHSVAENASLGTVIGSPLAFVDPDAGDDVAFSLVEDAGGRFAIDGSNQVIVAGVLDYETAPSHSITIRATDGQGATYQEAFTVTVSNVSETPPADPPPDDDPVVDDEDHFDVQPYSVVVDGSVKFAGKKKANGLSAKFMHDFSADAGALAANTAHVVEFTVDASLLAEGGDLSLFGFMFKHGNDFYSIGPRGDGAGGLKAFQIYGAGKWNQNTGFTQTDGGALANGTQWGPIKLRLTISANGRAVTLASGSSFTNWTAEISNAELGPFDDVGDVTQWGIGGVFDADDSGAYVLDVANYRVFPVPTITSSNTASVAENAALSKSLTSDQTVTWSIVGGADQADFEISGSTLRWTGNGSKDFEAPDDADTNNTYVVTVRASNSTSGLTSDQTITVTVTDVSEGFGAHRVWRSYFTGYNGGGSALTIGEIAYRDVSAGSNLITGGTASASSERAGSEANKAIDANGTTAWWSGSSLVGEYWQYDYGASNTEALVEVAITHDNDLDAATTSIREAWFAYSDSASSWFGDNNFSLAFGVTGQTSWSLSQQKTFTDPALNGATAHRYWGVVVLNNGGGGSVAIAKLEFRASIGGADQVGSGTPISALGTPSNAFDGNAGTHWQGGSVIGFLGYDFGSAVSVAQLAITGRSDSGLTSPNRLCAVCSDNGTHWSIAGPMFTSASWSAGETRTFNL